MTEIYRKLGLHDRYSLSRSLIGSPPVVAIVSTLIPPDKGSIEEELSKVQDLLSSRISKLLEIVPFLSARVTDHQSMEPKWVKSERILTSKDILHLNLIEDQVGVGLEEICSKQLEVGIKTLMPSQKGPLWRVDIHHRLDSRLIYIGLSVNHTLADGKGSFNLYQLLISPPFDLSRDLTQTQVEMIRGVKVFPDPSDVSCMRSDWEKPLTKTSESISSASSKKDQDPVAESECWPYTIEKRIKDCQPDLILIQLKRKGILKDLKDNCIKLGSIKTFHAAIHSSIIVGILSLNLMENPSRIKGDGYGIENSSRDKIGLKSATPINIRKGEFGLIVGNFVGVSEWQGQFDPSSLFWKVTKEHDKELNSVEGRKKALSFIGMLDNMPDSIKENPDGTKKTGWEIYLDSKDSYADSFSLSNLGKFSLEPPSSSTNPIKISSLAWCQTPSISSAALAVDVCGLSEDENENGERGGLSISIGFREGTLSREAVKKVAEVVKKTLNDLSEGKIGKDTTFWDLSRSG